MSNIEKIVALLHQGTALVTPQEALRKKLERGKPLKIKLGMDPTAPDLHLGHAVVLRKMRQFQDLGHEVIFLIGDFTARIGDPSGRSKTRPPLDEKEIAHNMQTYFEQVGKVLDTKKVIIAYNSTWLGAFSNADILQLCAKVTLARIIERDDFAKRIAENQPIGFHELFYPIYQGYDSVALVADVELGGTDQTFNLMMGRFLQEQYGQEPQVVITVPLLEGLDGVQKMSKSLGNAVGLAEPPSQAFGKLMSLSDVMMWRYFDVLLGRSREELSQLQERVASGNTHPMELKKAMAHEIITTYWSEQEADAARSEFEALFQQKDYSKAQEVSLPADCPQPVWIVDLLKLLGAIESSSEARRLIESKAVLIDDEAVIDFKANIGWRSNMTVKVGKHRIYKIK